MLARLNHFTVLLALLKCAGASSLAPYYLMPMNFSAPSQIWDHPQPNDVNFTAQLFSDPSCTEGNQTFSTNNMRFMLDMPFSSLILSTPLQAGQYLNLAVQGEVIGQYASLDIYYSGVLYNVGRFSWDCGIVQKTITYDQTVPSNMTNGLSGCISLSNTSSAFSCIGLFRDDGPDLASECGF